MTPRKPGRWLPKRIVAGLAVALGLMGVRARADFDWNLPKGFPRPAVPVDNPMTAAKVELGRYLFYDTRLSVNGKESCGAVIARNWLLRMGARSPVAPPGNSTREAV
jgi:cytochrome c peroxidase